MRGRYSNNASTAKEPSQTQDTSRWSSSMGRKSLRKSGISALFHPSQTRTSTDVPPLPPLDHLRSPSSQPPTPRLPTSRSRLFNLGGGSKSKPPPTPPPPTQTASTSLSPAPSLRSSLKSKSSRSHSPRRKVLDPTLQPVSSDNLPPPRPLLDELSARDEATAQGDPKEDKRKKVLAWRSDVGENEGLSKLEDMMARHVEREREALREIAVAASPRK